MHSSLWLLPTVRLALLQGDAVFYDGMRQLRLTKLAAAVRRVVPFLDGEHGEESLRHPFGRRLVALLDRHGWIVRLAQPLAETLAARPVRSRQLSYFAHLSAVHPDRAFEELARARVFIIGTGGIGSHVAFHLLASGVRELVLNDFDDVDASNLNRQILFCSDDLGRPKVHVLASALKKRFPDARVETIPADLDYDGLAATVEQVDLVLLCGEHRTPLNRPSVIGGRSIVTAGYFGCEAFVGPAVSPCHGTPRWDEVIREGERRGRSNVEDATHGLINNWNSSGATNNAVGGALLAEVAVRLLAPSLGGPLLLMTRRFMDMRTLTLRDEVISAEEVRT